MRRAFHVIAEGDEDGRYVGAVSELPGCHTQARSLDRPQGRVHEATGCVRTRPPPEDGGRA